MKKSVMDVIVVGGGAAGLMAAIIAARSGAKVLILEHNEVAGKKILATGNGRCNFTNMKQGPAYYRSDSPAFVLPVLNQFSAEDSLSFFQGLGVMTIEKNGYCYPRNLQASVIREALLREVDKLGIKLLGDMGIRSIKADKNGFVLDTKTGTFYGKKCILATGGKADPKSGSDGSGYIYAKQLGHSLTTTVPALVPLVSDATWLKAVKGVRQDAKVTLFINGKEIFADHGEVQFTDYGVSGIPVFQISRFATKALVNKEMVEVMIDFLPEFTKEEVLCWLEHQINEYKISSTIIDVLSGMVNQKIAIALGEQLPFSKQFFGNLSRKQLHVLLEQTTTMLKETCITIVDNKNFQQAQVTAGGIQTTEVHPESMESKLVPGLYFAGEILDVDGMCGGYNLQWAWSSGYVAGIHASMNL